MDKIKEIIETAKNGVQIPELPKGWYIFDKSELMELLKEVCEQQKEDCVDNVISHCPNDPTWGEIETHILDTPLPDVLKNEPAKS